MNLPLDMLRVVAIGALLAFVLPLAADPLDDLIGADQAKAMGLDKLAPAERTALAQWIEQQGTGPKPSAGVVPTAVAATPAVAATAPDAFFGATLVGPPPTPAPAPKPAIVAGSTAAFGLDQSEIEGAVEKLEARIVGEFTGWDGKTVFRLDNGQVWRQSTAGVYRFKLHDPAVVIERNIFGYKLRLLETKRSIAVRRVK